MASRPRPEPIRTCFSGKPLLGGVSPVAPGPGTNGEVLVPAVTGGVVLAELEVAGGLVVTVVAGVVGVVLGVLGVVIGVVGVVIGVVGVVGVVIGVVGVVIGVVIGVVGVVTGVVGVVGVVTGVVGVVSGLEGVVTGEVVGAGILQPFSKIAIPSASQFKEKVCPWNMNGGMMSPHFPSGPLSGNIGPWCSE
jgi:hypothetical protein